MIPEKFPRPGETLEYCAWVETDGRGCLEHVGTILTARLDLPGGGTVEQSARWSFADARACYADIDALFRHKILNDIRSEAERIATEAVHLCETEGMDR